MKETLPIDTAISALELSIEQQAATLRQLRRARDEVVERQRLAEQAFADEQEFPPGDLLETWEAASRYRKAPDTIRDWAQNKGVGVKRGGRWLVSKRRIDRMLGYD